ncbi:MAG: HD domain-containing phosphohydrolase [Oscillospiraceae bacterium]
MRLFKKKHRAVPTAEEEAAVAVQAPQKSTLDSGRLAPVFLRMYRWIISVNLAADVYQIESGELTLDGQPLPARGHYSQLIRLISSKVAEEQKSVFDEVFQAKALANVFSAAGTGVSGIYCLAEHDNTDFGWYEVRAEHIPNDKAPTLQCILFVRRLRDSNDYGNEPQKNPKAAEDDSEKDWVKIRVQRMFGGKNDVCFEYNIAQDCLTVRHGGVDALPQKTEKYLARINAKSGLRIHPDCVSEVRRLLRDAIDGKEGEAVIRYRAGGDYGAPFRHYHMSCMPLEQTGKPTWVFGCLRDIDEEYRRDSELREVTSRINGFMDKVFSEIYLIDAEKDLIWRVIRTDNGYKREEKRHSFSGRIKTQIERGVIAPESASAYLEWTEKGFLSRKTAKGNWDMEGRLKLPGSIEYRWYDEMLTAVKDRPNMFLQIRRDVTETRSIRQQEFELQEKLHLSDYNQSMLDVMADLVEFRNVESGMHILHVRNLTKILLEDVSKRSPQYELGPRKIELYCRAVTVHDIGKITIPDAILNKRGALTEEELAVMRTHTTNGALIIDHMNMPGEEELKSYCRDIVLHHHERWDGDGYPDHLQGDAVPIGTQAAALVDAYDALVSERCYKEAYSHEKALKMILAGECGSFNPRLLESLKACKELLRKEYEAHTDDENNETVNEVTDNGR